MVSKRRPERGALVCWIAFSTVPSRRLGSRTRPIGDDTVVGAGIL
jgi:hypothetical protein